MLSITLRKGFFNLNTCPTRDATATSKQKAYDAMLIWHVIIFNEMQLFYKTTQLKLLHFNG